MRHALLCAVLALLICAPSVRSDDSNLLLSGSTTLIPIVTNAAEAFTTRYRTWNRFDPALPARPIVIETAGGGSGQGVRAVLDGVASAGMVARELREQELERLGSHQAVRVGIDAVAVAARSDNPLRSQRQNLTAAELHRLLSGEVATYRAFDSNLPDREVVLLVRDASAGSAVMIQRQFLGETPVSPRALQMSSQGQLLRSLQGNPHTLAYISAGLVNAHDDISAFAIDGVQPSDDNVVSGAYELARPLLIVHRDTPNPYLAAFMRFLLGPDGQAIVADLGYIPVSAAN
ncbi:MAG: substrate-binding domain-containing protein [Gammaproteobacteria bacterium]|nr:substrate-binding domain-containing protein [Gammaproteobacteria bacterium]